GDRFQLEVTSPSQYNGAIIEGRIANADQSGRVSGRANLSMEFDTIRLTNGQTYRFAGFIDSVRAANGDNVQVNNEGTVRDSNQTTKTVTRAGIGAALGAIIGAIAGGGQGAAIGAAVGAGAGAGTVILQGRDNIELGQGSEFGITASGPNNIR
ncbi:MAG: YMGG-like glycine zipper-containing protein, partial [Pyrinomonadaceae bacterium]